MLFFESIINLLKIHNFNILNGLCRVPHSQFKFYDAIVDGLNCYMEFNRIVIESHELPKRVFRPREHIVHIWKFYAKSFFFKKILLNLKSNLFLFSKRSILQFKHFQ